MHWINSHEILALASVKCLGNHDLVRMALAVNDKLGTWQGHFAAKTFPVVQKMDSKWKSNGCMN